MPVSVSPSFIGWPPYLLQIANIKGDDLIVIASRAARCERQWKSFLSWMLGVAGARHVLASEGYTWVAPVSAFYPGVAQEVDLTGWNLSFPPSVLSASAKQFSQSRLRPDYLALRPAGTQGYYWAIAEAKGTRLSLENMQKCPKHWSNQARNINLTLNGSRLAIPRHLVIATRTNPNAARTATHRIQVRAWNRKDERIRLLPAEAAVEVAAAHLFGLFKGVGLTENARAIALSVQIRGLNSPKSGIQKRLLAPSFDDLAPIAERADAELNK